MPSDASPDDGTGPSEIQYFALHMLRLLGVLVLGGGIVAGIEVSWSGRPVLGVVVAFVAVFFGLLGQVVHMIGEVVVNAFHPEDE